MSRHIKFLFVYLFVVFVIDRLSFWQWNVIVAIPIAFVIFKLLSGIQFKITEIE